MAKGRNNNGNGKVINSQAAIDKAVKSICDILRRDKAKGVRLHVPELTWMFFLRYLDIMGEKEEQRAKALGGTYHEPIEPPYRWRGWVTGGKRHELSEEHGLGSFLSFVNAELFPYLKNLGETPGASDKQKVISGIFRNKEKTILPSQTNHLDALDGVWRLSEFGFWR